MWMGRQEKRRFRDLPQRSRDGGEAIGTRRVVDDEHPVTRSDLHLRTVDKLLALMVHGRDLERFVELERRLLGDAEIGTVAHDHDGTPLSERKSVLRYERRRRVKHGLMGLDSAGDVGEAIFERGIIDAPRGTGGIGREEHQVLHERLNAHGDEVNRLNAHAIVDHGVDMLFYGSFHIRRQRNAGHSALAHEVERGERVRRIAALGNRDIESIFLIDEIDATLHPIAQNNLIDFLYRKSIDLELQIVFTTHSLSLLNHVIRKQELSNNQNLSTIYLTNKRGQLEPIHNPTISYIQNDLMNTYTGANRNNDVPIFTEDDIGRWFFQKIINHIKTDENFQISFIDMHTGWTEIIKLMKHDYNYFKNFIVALDPDINHSENYLTLKNMLIGTRFSLERKHTNILILPGDTYIEKMMWDFVSNLDLDDEFYYEPSIEEAALTKDALINQGPYSNVYQQFSSDKQKIKAWFNNHKWLSDVIFSHWIKKQENQILSANFYNKFKEAYNPIYHQRR